VIDRRLARLVNCLELQRNVPDRFIFLRPNVASRCVINIFTLENGKSETRFESETHTEEAVLADF
jgi:hypothetical protein